MSEKAADWYYRELEKAKECVRHLEAVNTELVILLGDVVHHFSRFDAHWSESERRIVDRLTATLEKVKNETA